MKKTILIIIACFIGNFSFANTDFEQANKAYSEGKYEDAIVLYEKMLKGDKQSATVYYNLANSYYKKGALAEAILNYERAYRLNPSDKDITTNLAFAQSQIADKIATPKRYFFSQWWHGFIRRQQDSDFWAYLGIAFWGLLFLSIVLFIRSNSIGKRKMFFGIALVSLLISAFAFYASYSQYDKIFNEKYAIVFAQNITASSTPSNNGTELFILHEGTRVKILDKVGDWYKIQLADKREGWLPMQEIVQI